MGKCLTPTYCVSVCIWWLCINSAQLDEVYALFDLLRCNRVFVVSYGVLVGVISRRILIDKIRALQN